MKRLGISTRAISRELAAALGQPSPEARQRAELRTWADGVIMERRAQGRVMSTVDAVWVSLYEEQKKTRAPNSDMSRLLREIAADIVATPAPKLPECPRCSWVMQVVNREANTWACVGDRCPDYGKVVRVAERAS